MAVQKLARALPKPTPETEHFWEGTRTTGSNYITYIGIWYVLAIFSQPKVNITSVGA